MLGSNFYLSIAFTIGRLDKLCRNCANKIFGIFKYLIKFVKMLLGLSLPPFHGYVNFSLFTRICFSLLFILLERIGLTVCKSYYR